MTTDLFKTLIHVNTEEEVMFANSFFHVAFPSVRKGDFRTVIKSDAAEKESGVSELFLVRSPGKYLNAYLRTVGSDNVDAEKAKKHVEKIRSYYNEILTLDVAKNSFYILDTDYIVQNIQDSAQKIAEFFKLSTELNKALSLELVKARLSKLNVELLRSKIKVAEGAVNDIFDISLVEKSFEELLVIFSADSLNELQNAYLQIQPSN